jgi:hypothetical protein
MEDAHPDEPLLIETEPAKRRMNAAERRKAQIEKIRRLLERQGENFTLSRVAQMGQTDFLVPLSVPFDTEGRPTYGAHVTVDWHVFLGVLLAKFAPRLVGQLKTAHEAIGDDEKALEDEGRRLAHMVTHWRDPQYLRAQRALAHAVFVAPEFFDGALRLMLASAEAWDAANDDDPDRASKIVADAFKAEEKLARERLQMRKAGRRPAVKHGKLQQVLLSFYEQGRNLREWTRVAVAEELTRLREPATDRTLTDYAAGSVYENWERLTAAYHAEFAHLEGLDEEELEMMIADAGDAVH